MWWLLLAVGVAPACNVTARSSSRLQAQFEVLPAPGAAGWLGADSDLSALIGGNRALWVFADTFIGKYDAATGSRVEQGWAMPHN